MIKTPRYLLASRTTAPVDEFERRRKHLSGDWTIARTPAELKALAEQTDPDAIFFPHWSAKVPESILGRWTCVCFHMTDLPYGRGGSPLQNLVVRGHEETQISALRMTEELDAGPIFLKRPLSLAGSAEEIYGRAAHEIFDMIESMIADWPEEKQQEGAVVHFERLKPEESRIPPDIDLQELYDRIRMVDAPGYPNAFIDHGPWRLRFTDATKTGEGLGAVVHWERRPNED